MCCRWNTPCCATVHDRRVMTHGSGGNEFQRRVHVELVEHGSIPQWGFSEKEQVCIRYTEYIYPVLGAKILYVHIIPGSLCCYYGTSTRYPCTVPSGLSHSGLSSSTNFFIFFSKFKTGIDLVWRGVWFPLRDSQYILYVHSTTTERVMFCRTWY